MALAAIAAAVLTWRSSRTTSSVEERKVDIADFEAVTSGLRTDLDKTRIRLDFIEEERVLDNRWIDTLRQHIMDGNPPPPPERPSRIFTTTA